MRENAIKKRRQWPKTSAKRRKVQQFKYLGVDFSAEDNMSLRMSLEEALRLDQPVRYYQLGDPPLDRYHPFEPRERMVAKLVTALKAPRKPEDMSITTLANHVEEKLLSQPEPPTAPGLRWKQEMDGVIDELAVYNHVITPIDWNKLVAELNAKEVPKHANCRTDGIFTENSKLS